MSRRQGVTPAGWLRMFRQEAWCAQGGRCRWCRSPMPLHEATAEHLTPQSVWGGLEHRQDIAAAHAYCNSARGSIPVREFEAILRGDLPAPSFAIRMIAMSRRINDRADLACKRILAVAGVR